MGKGRGTLVPLIKPPGASPPVYLAGRAPPARCPQPALWTKPCTRQGKHLRHPDLERFSELPADVTLTDRICTHAGDRTQHCRHAMPSTRQQPCPSSMAPSNAPTRRWNYRAWYTCHSFPDKTHLQRSLHRQSRQQTGEERSHAPGYSPPEPPSHTGEPDPMLQVPLAGHHSVLSQTPEPMTSTFPGMQRGMHPGKTRTERVPCLHTPDTTDTGACRAQSSLWPQGQRDHRGHAGPEGKLRNAAFAP